MNTLNTKVDLVLDCKNEIGESCFWDPRDNQLWWTDIKGKKIWCIDENTSKRTLYITSQRSIWTDNPKLSRNYSTNDRMLRYKHLKEYFFMDTFFATSKAKKSSRGHTYVKISVTNKGFIYVVPMKTESQVLQAI